MAGIGVWNTLKEDALKAAFDKAKSEGCDYLVKVEYTTQGEPMGMRGIPVLLDMIDFHEAAYGVSRDTAADDLRRIYRAHGALNILAVYDLSEEFAGIAHRGDEGKLPLGALQSVRGEISADRHKAALAARPWYKKLLGLAP